MQCVWVGSRNRSSSRPAVHAGETVQLLHHVRAQAARVAVSFACNTLHSHTHILPSISTSIPTTSAVSLLTKPPAHLESEAHASLGAADHGTKPPASPGPLTGGQARSVPDAFPLATPRRNLTGMEGPRLLLDAASVWTIGAGLTVPDWSSEDSCGDGNFGSPFDSLETVSYTHLTLPTKRIV